MISIDDIIKTLDDTEAGKTFRELIEESNFLETEFNFPGAKKSVTGSEILQHIESVEISEGIGSIAAYDPASKKIHFDTSVMKQLAPVLEQSGLSPEAVAKYLQEQFSFTTIHELGHAGADLVGVDDIEKRAKGQKLGKQMPESVAKHIAEQEKIADSFAEEVFKSAGKDPSQYSYLTAAEALTYNQQVLLGRELTVDESLQLVEDRLRQSNIDPKSRLQLAVSYLEGDIQSEKLKLMSDSYSYGESVKIKKAGSRQINQPSKPTRTVTKRRKVGKPVLSVGQKPPPPTKAGSQQTAATVTQSGNATPKPQAAIISTPKPTSTGAPLAATSPASRSLADNMSAAAAKGIKGSGSLKMLGAAALVGLGASAISRRRTQQENIDRRLEMQRRGIIT